jgi:four helix bundle protein
LVSCEEFAYCQVIHNDITGFEKLKVWEKSVQLSKKVFTITEHFQGYYRIKEQLSSSTLSISSNIAEGKGRETIPEFRRFLIYARGSAYECLSQLHVLKECQLLKENDFNILRTDLIEIIKMINALRKHLQNKL